MNSRKPLFSIVIATRGRARFLADLLSDIARSVPVDREVIVVNDGGDTETERICRQTFPFRLVHLASATRLNSCVARNMGIEHTRGTWLMFLDDDVRLPEGFFETCEALAARYEAFSVRIQNRRPARPGALKRLLERWFRGGFIAPLGLFIGGFEADRVAPVPVDHLPGAMMAFSKLAVGDVRFDPRIGEGNGYLDDADFSYSIGRSGHILMYDPETYVDHLQAGSGGNREPDRKRWFWYVFSHRVYFVRKHHSALILPTVIAWGLLETCMRSLVWRVNLIPAFVRSLRHAKEM